MCVLDMKRERLKVNIPPVQEEEFGYLNISDNKLSPRFL